MEGYLYISFKNDTIREYKFYDNTDQIMIERGFNIDEVDTSHAQHAYPLLKQVYREIQLSKIGIDE